LSQAALSWVPLEKDLNEQTKTAIESLNLSGLGFESYQLRSYPESSMAAQLLGFVGSDGTGRPKGYFGLEGFYNLELYGQPGLVSQDKDALGKPIIIGQYQKTNSIDGRHLVTHLDRGLQLIIETELHQALDYYQALSGEVVIMEPKTGAIMALASLPAYDPSDYRSFASEQFRLPAVADTYEPGSTFKTIIMAGAIETGAVTPETVCDNPCAGPVSIGQYQIKTWDGVYNPGQTVREILMRSDNTGMVFIANKMGQETFLKNLDNFGIGLPTGIDLQREAIAPLRSSWANIDIATGSFGQGLAVNSLQMVAAVGALANGGNMMQPQVVDYLVEEGKVIDREPKILSRPVSPETAKIMTQLMVDAASEGEAKWAIPKGYRIAGKTGTAQVAIAGHYDASKTIASFIGFAPAENPRFVMLVKLQEPLSSPWASETAAPLWVDIAKKIFIYYNISPES
jgi:cell division protein FtsI/penicillin-binding protein 2